MNIIDKLRIKANPNVIDSWSSSKLSDEVISYAISNGYKFNPDSVANLSVFSSYSSTFKNEPEFIGYIKEYSLSSQSLFGFNIYTNEEVLDIFSKDIDFAKGILSIPIPTGLDESIVVDLVKRNNDITKVVLENMSNIRLDGSNSFFNYIANTMSPNDVFEISGSLDSFSQAFINTGNPKKICQLAELNSDNISQHIGSIRSQINENIDFFLPYLNSLNSLCGNTLFDEELSNNVISYLINNNIPYSENVPVFALDNTQYVLNCLSQQPSVLSKIENDIPKIDFNLYPDIANKISKKIISEQISFSEIPELYQYCREIYESILSVSPDLILDSKNRIWLDKITEEMSDEERVEYLKSIKFPFNADTVNTFGTNNFYMILECLKNDYMTISDTKMEFSLEQYELIYQTLKNTIALEDVLNSNFLTQNPYFVMDLISNNIDISNVDLQQTRYYEELFPSIKAIAIHNGVDIPTPKTYDDVVQFNGNNVFVNLDNLDSINKGLEYLKNNNIDQPLTIVLRQSKVDDEFVIADNLAFFEQLMQSGANINFMYDNGESVFSLSEIIESEHNFEHMVNMIKEKNFSPLEQLIAVYDIAKIFKPYKKASNDFVLSSQSRSLFEYLHNDFMVCAGYSNLIVNMGYRLNARYSEIGLQAHEPHSRNYVNIVDKKYGIDGYYVVEPTWEQSGKASGIYEPERSSYNYFLLTTNEGRKEVDMDSSLHGGYDTLLTMQTPEEIINYFNDSSNENKSKWIKRIRLLDPEFYKVFTSLDLTKTEDAQVLLDYFHSKVNKTFSKEKLLDAVMEVKRVMNPNLSPQDLEDMRMMYSTTSPFSTTSLKSLYGDNCYSDYMKKRYDNLKDMTLEQAQAENVCLPVRNLCAFMMHDALSMYKSSLGTLDDHYEFGLNFNISDNTVLELLKKNKQELKALGFSFIDNEELYGEDINDVSEDMLITPYISYSFSFDNTQSIQSQIEQARANYEQVCNLIGIEFSYPSVDMEQLSDNYSLVSAADRQTGAQRLSKATKLKQKEIIYDGVEK